MRRRGRSCGRSGPGGSPTMDFRRPTLSRVATTTMAISGGSASSGAPANRHCAQYLTGGIAPSRLDPLLDVISTCTSYSLVSLRTLPSVVFVLFVALLVLFVSLLSSFPLCSSRPGPRPGGAPAWRRSRRAAPLDPVRPRGRTRLARRGPRTGLANQNLAQSGGRPAFGGAPRGGRSDCRREQRARARTEAWGLARPVVCAELDPSLERYAFPRIGRRLVSEVNTADMLGIQTPTWHVKAETASAGHQRIRALLGWAIAMNLRRTIPATACCAARPAERHRDAPAGAVPQRAWLRPSRRYARRGPDGPHQRRRSRFWCSPLPGRRKSDFSTWAETNATNRVWTMSAMSMKAKREHRVLLCARALVILDTACALGEGNPLVFRMRSGRAISASTLPKMLQYHRTPPWRAASASCSGTARLKREIACGRSSRRAGSRRPERGQGGLDLG